ncbi:hypothetical protein [Actinacidiphila glaucinigra]|uniref:hypothetical protein n=1 Tax=Actinacidiphila glaucinigra TaxID=235986 RepID=UPI003D8F578A
MARFEDLRSSLRDPGNRRGVQPPLSGRFIAAAERPLRVALPGSLLDLLRHRNGGVVSADRDALPMSRPTSWSAGHVPFETVMGIGRGLRLTAGAGRLPAQHSGRARRFRPAGPAVPFGAT